MGGWVGGWIDGWINTQLQLHLHTPRCTLCIYPATEVDVMYLSRHRDGRYVFIPPPMWTLCMYPATKVDVMYSCRYRGGRYVFIPLTRWTLCIPPVFTNGQIQTKFREWVGYVTRTKCLVLGDNLDMDLVQCQLSMFILK